MYELKYTHIGNVENYYGGIVIAEKDGKFYYSILNYNGPVSWEEIPGVLYHCLLKWEKSMPPRDKNYYRDGIKFLSYEEMFGD